MIPVSRPHITTAESAFVMDAICRNQLTHGPLVQRFERELAAFLGCEDVIAVANGTVALHLVLTSLGIGPGDEVIVPDITFVATANAVKMCGADVVLADVDRETWGLDWVAAAEKITERTKAIIPVHLYGAPCDMKGLLDITIPRGILVIEDAAEGFAGSYRGRKLGTLGDAGTFSFYGNKVLTTGEGGAVAVNNAALAARLRLLRGQAMDPERRYYHTEVGYNYRLSDLHAAVGLGQLAHLPGDLVARRAIFRAYAERLCYDRGVIPSVRPDCEVAPWLFTLLVKSDRDGVSRQLLDAGVETRPTFVPLHRLPMYAGRDADFPVASYIGDHGISLPTFVGLTTQQVNYVCEQLIRRL